MTYWHGFVLGAIGGLFATLLATGNIVFIEFTEQAKGIMFVVLLVVFVLTQGITLYSAHERASLFNPTADGFIVGVGFMEAIVVFLLYGFRP